MNGVKNVSRTDYATLKATRRHRARAKLPLFLGAMSLLIPASQLMGAASVSQAGAVSLSADTRVGGASAGFSALTTDPVITEGAFADLTGTIVITAPANYQFNTGQNVTATPGGGNDIDLGAGAANPQTATPLATTITFTINAVSTAAGTITFTDIQLQPSDCTGATVGTHDLTVTAGGGDLTGTTIATATVTPGVADHLAFTVQPSSSAAGADLVPAVTIQDACDNTVTGDDRNITLAIQTNPGSATLNGTKTKASTTGVATWAAGESLDITTAANGYTLRASHDGAAFAGSDTVDSNAFNIATGGALNNFLVTAAPTNLAAGAPSTVTVTARDVFNNAIGNFDPTTNINITTSAGGSGAFTFTDGATGTLVIVDDGDDTGSIDATGALTFAADGTATFNISSSQGIGPVVITVSDGTAGGTTTASATNVTWNAANPETPDDGVTGGGTTDEDGALEATIKTGNGATVGSIVVEDAPPGVSINATVTQGNLGADDAPGPGMGTFAGFANGQALGRTLTVTTDATPGTYRVTVAITFSAAEIAASGLDPANIRLHVLDEDQNPPVWVPAGPNNVGQGPSTTNVGDSGYVIDEDGNVTFWTVRDKLSIFAVGAAAPGDDDDSSDDGDDDSDEGEDEDADDGDDDEADDDDDGDEDEDEEEDVLGDSPEDGSTPGCALLNAISVSLTFTGLALLRAPFRRRRK